MSQIQKFLLGMFFIIMGLYTSYEVYDELQDLMANNETIWHVSVEILVVLITLSGLVYFVYIINQQSKKQKTLEVNLVKIKKDLESSNIKLQDGKKEYQKVIQWQFSEWRLSPSEKEVALLILKGLSLKDIANCRSTREKTVRRHTQRWHGHVT
jgi:DNA-binding NarL/FixJ family response regulator